MDNTKIVGEKIKAIREAKQISIEELVERTGLAVEQIESIEANVVIPSLAPLIKIARALGVRLGTFLDDQDESGAVICRSQERIGKSISFSNNAMSSRTHAVSFAFGIQGRPSYGAIHNRCGSDR